MCKLKVIILFLVFYAYVKEVAAIRKGKTLIFPPTAPTRTQLIYGIGIPLPLEYESMTTGYVLKAEYFLPTMASELRPLQLNPQSINKRELLLDNRIGYENDTSFADDYNDAVTERYIRETKNHKPADGRNSNIGKYRWAVYRAVETIAERLGMDGRACMLRALCEAAEAPFHYSSGILAELMHIVMTPSASMDPISKHSDNEYFHAEFLGKSGAPCEVVFKECSQSILSIFSGTYNPSMMNLVRNFISG